MWEIMVQVLPPAMKKKEQRVEFNSQDRFMLNKPERDHWYEEQVDLSTKTEGFYRVKGVERGKL